MTLNNVFNCFFFDSVNNFSIVYTTESEIEIKYRQYGDITFTLIKGFGLRITSHDITESFLNGIVRLKNLTNTNIKVSKNRDLIERDLKDGGHPTVGFFIKHDTEMYRVLEERVKYFIRKYSDAL